MSTELTTYEKALEWFVNKVRRRMIDFDHLNELIGRQEQTDSEIKNAIEDTIDRYNTMPPPIGSSTINDFPSQDLLITGTMSRLLESSAILHDRNHLGYSAAGMTVDTHSMAASYRSKANELWQKFEQQADELKQALNIADITGSPTGIGSPYGVMGWFSNTLSI